MKLSRRDARIRRHKRVRSAISGAADRPRVCVSCSNRHILAQAIDDAAGRTLAAVATVSKEAAGKNHCNRANAERLGRELGERIKKLGIDRVVFDRGGHLYHGVVKAFADGVRSADQENHFHF
ncbi:MAG TPA: 50S ribosomal protein L18 [Sumerlaeia bacterium]|nr:50S ribosomal protein L18 [Sumerlaeia bacterium]